MSHQHTHFICPSTFFTAEISIHCWFHLLTTYLSLFVSTAAINAQAFSARKSPHHTAPNTASRGLSTRKSLSPYLDLQTLPAQSIVKPSLRKSLGGQASRGRTPFDALKSPGMHLARSAIRSAMTHSSAGEYSALMKFSSGSQKIIMINFKIYTHLPGTVRGGDVNDNDDVDRLTFSQAEAGAEPSAVPDAVSMDADDDLPLDINCRTQALFADDDGPVAGFGSSKKNRRSWGVVVNSLVPSASPRVETGGLGASSDLVHSPLKQRASPPKKKRCRKSTSPTKGSSGSKAVSFEPAEAKAVVEPFAMENLAPLENATQMLPMSAPSQPTKSSRGSQGSRGGATATNTLLATLTAPTNVSLQRDEAVNAFDRLLASTSTMMLAPPVKKAAPVSQGSREGKRGASQQTNSLMNL